MTFGHVLVPSDFIILINEQYIKVFIDYSRLDSHMFYLIIMSIHNRICNKSNLTSATCGVGNSYPSGEPEFIPTF